MNQSPFEQAQPDRALQNLLGSIRVLAADVRELLAQTAEHSGEQMSRLRNRAREALAAVETRIAPVQQTVAERARSAANVSVEHLRVHRWSTVAAVAAVAFVVVAVCAWQNEVARYEEESGEGL